MCECVLTLFSISFIFNCCSFESGYLDLSSCSCEVENNSVFDSSRKNWLSLICLWVNVSVSPAKKRKKK